MFRSLVKTTGCRVLHWTGMDRLMPVLDGSSNMPVVIGYHRVVEDFPSEAKRCIPPMLISRRMFERHLDWIGRRFQFISIGKLGSMLERGEKFDRPVAAITFDDGYRDNYDVALPVLLRKGIPAAVFVTTGPVGDQQPLVHDALHHLLRSAFSRWPDASRGMNALLRDLGISSVQIEPSSAAAKDHFAAMRLLLSTLSQADICLVLEALKDSFHGSDGLPDGIKPLSWEMLAKMVQSGITIGSHTRTHILLPNESQARGLQETEGSRRDLETKLGIVVRHFAYPDGRFNRRAVQAVAAAGFRYAYTTCRHRDPQFPLLTIPRRILWENSCLSADGSFSPAIMSCQVNGIFDFRAGCGQDHQSPANGEVRVSKSKKVGWVL